MACVSEAWGIVIPKVVADEHERMKLQGRRRWFLGESHSRCPLDTHETHTSVLCSESSSRLRVGMSNESEEAMARRPAECHSDARQYK